MRFRRDRENHARLRVRAFRRPRTGGLAALRLAGAALTFALAAGAGPAFAEPIRLIAAESVYGDIAAQIGGAEVDVTSLLTGAGQDPHLFEASPEIARTLADADIVVVNGADYDPWVDDLLAATPRPQRTVFNVGVLIGAPAGSNPHLWYRPDAWTALAAALADELSRREPGRTDLYRQRLNSFRASLEALESGMISFRERHGGTPVTATEPVFGLMAEALGLDMRNREFQTAIMNETEPSARDVGALEDDLRNRRVKALIFNSQVSGPISDRLVAIAREAGIAVVGVTEVMPQGVSFQEWMLSQIESLDRALSGPPA